MAARWDCRSPVLPYGVRTTTAGAGRVPGRVRSAESVRPSRTGIRTLNLRNTPGSAMTRDATGGRRPPGGGLWRGRPRQNGRRPLDPGAPSVVQAENGFLDVAAPSRSERGFHSDDLEARLLENPQRGGIVTGRASVHRPGRHQVEKQRERPGRDAPPPPGAIDPVRDLRLAAGDKAGDGAHELP